LKSATFPISYVRNGKWSSDNINLFNMEYLLESLHFFPPKKKQIA